MLRAARINDVTSVPAATTPDAIGLTITSKPNLIGFAGRFRLLDINWRLGKFGMSLLRSSVSALLLCLAVGLVGYYYGFSGIIDTLQKLSPPTIGIVLLALLGNAFAAALRFQVVATDTGHPIGYRRAMAAVAAGSLAGAVFFQLAGQLMARGLIARRGGMPFAAVVAVTLYERIVAAIISGLLALGGALFIFGNLYLNQEAGGAALIKIMCGLIAATMGGALIGYGPLAARNVAPLITRRFVQACARIVALTLTVQLPMMTAYVVVTHALSPQIPIADLVAASVVVMFAASVPISLAGWGVRELSAIVALGAIGMPTYDALTAAVIIGATSMLSMGALALVSSFGRRAPVGRKAEEASVKSVDYTHALAWALPIAAAVLVLFQIYVPIGSGLLNVNLADPVAILGGSLFVLQAVNRRQWPVWRVKYANLFVLLATLALGYSLLLGAYRFGWTDWALVNRFAGWFVLLAYVATGALIVSVGDMRAFKVFALTFVGAAVGVVLLDLGLVFVSAIGFHTSGLIIPNEIAGFAQNHNALAFQLLMALAAGFVFLERCRLRIFVFAIFFAAFWFAGSRSGWISLFCVSALAWHFKRVTLGELAAALAGVVILVGVVNATSLIAPLSYFGHATGGGVGHAGRSIVPQILPDSFLYSRAISFSPRWLGVICFTSDLRRRAWSICQFKDFDRQRHPACDSFDRTMAAGRVRPRWVFYFSGSCALHLDR